MEEMRWRVKSKDFEQRKDLFSYFQRVKLFNNTMPRKRFCSSSFCFFIYNWIPSIGKYKFCKAFLLFASYTCQTGKKKQLDAIDNLEKEI